VTKKAKRIGKILTLEQQIDLLKREVLVFNDDFERGTVGRIVSLQQIGDTYWVVLNHPYKKKNGKFSRRKLFNSEDLRLIDGK